MMSLTPVDIVKAVIYVNGMFSYFSETTAEKMHLSGCTNIFFTCVILQITTFLERTAIESLFRDLDQYNNVIVANNRL